MNFIWDKLTEWIRELLIEGIMNNLTGLFDQVNTQISGIADNVGKTPQQWNGSIFSMIQGLSDHVVVPIAGAILAVIATLELIQMIIDKNNFHDFDTFIIFKWVFKTAASVLIVTNTWNIVMGIFEAAQSVVNRASGLVMSGAQLSIESAITGIEARLADMELGALFGLWFQTMLIGFTMWALVICIFIITFGRMIEIYLVTSIAPIPMATMVSREWGQTGQNYLRTLFALGFQAFMMILCVAIYAVLVQNIAVTADVSRRHLYLYGIYRASLLRAVQDQQPVPQRVRRTLKGGIDWPYVPVPKDLTQRQAEGTFQSHPAAARCFLAVRLSARRFSICSSHMWLQALPRSSWCW